MGINRYVMSVERTLAILKPDLVESKKQGLAIQRIVDEGFNILALRQTTLTRAQTEAFYAEHQEQFFFQRLCDFMCSGPLILLALERQDAVAGFRKLLGATDPADAAEGTLRKEFGDHVSRNAAHGSDSVLNGQNECLFFFSGAELLK